MFGALASAISQPFNSKFPDARRNGEKTALRLLTTSQCGCIVPSAERETARIGEHGLNVWLMDIA